MPNRKASVSTAIFTGVLVIGLGAVGVSYSQQGKAAPKLSPAERQEIHSTLYPQFAGLRKVRDMDRGQQLNSSRATRFFRPDSLAPKPACVADAIVLGIVADQSPHLTKEETFIFTDYTISVGEVFKENPAAVIEPGGSIIVTRPGGTLILDGRSVKANDEDYPLLRLARRYLLFLQFIPQTGAYRGLRPGPDGVSVDDVSIENPDQKALDEARYELTHCGPKAGAR